METRSREPWTSFQSTSTLNSIRHSRLQDPPYVQSLTDRLNRARYLEAENGRLIRDVKLMQETVTRVTREASNIKSMYDNEVLDARRMLDETCKEKVRLQIDNERLWDEKEELKASLSKKINEIRDLERERDRLKKQVNGLVHEELDVGSLSRVNIEHNNESFVEEPSCNDQVDVENNTKLREELPLKDKEKKKKHRSTITFIRGRAFKVPNFKIRLRKRKTTSSNEDSGSEELGETSQRRERREENPFFERNAKAKINNESKKKKNDKSTGKLIDGEEQNEIEGSVTVEPPQTYQPSERSEESPLPGLRKRKTVSFNEDGATVELGQTSQAPARSEESPPKRKLITFNKDSATEELCKTSQTSEKSEENPPPGRHAKTKISNESQKKRIVKTAGKLADGKELNEHEGRVIVEPAQTSQTLDRSPENPPARRNVKRKICSETEKKRNEKSPGKLPDGKEQNDRRKIFACERCGDVLSSKGNLGRHIATVHEDQKPVKCEICGKGFAQKSHLAHHVPSHDVGPFQCVTCRQNFPTKRGLANHRRSTHR